MILDEDIEYWRKCSDSAPTKSAALVAIGVSLGLRIAQQSHSAVLLGNSEIIAGYLASCLASGPESKIHRVDPEKWSRDVKAALEITCRTSTLSSQDRA